MRHVLANLERTTIVLVLFLSSCIVNETQILRTPVHSERIEKVSDGWSYQAKINIREDGPRTVVHLQVTKHKTCTTTELQQVRQREIATKHWRGGSGWVVHGIVIASAVVAAGALINHYGNNGSYANDYGPAAPSTERSGIGATSVTGFALVGGLVALGVSGGFAVSQDVRAIDSSKDLGETTDTSVGEPIACKEEAAGRANVTVTGSDGITDDAGVLDATIANDDLASIKGDSLVQVEGQAIDSQALIDRRKNLQAEAAAERDRAARAERLAAINRESDEEVAAGKCNLPRAQSLQQVMAGFQQIFGDGTQGIVILDNALVIAKPGGQRLPLSFNLPGQYHIFAVGFSPASLSGGIGASPYAISISNMTGVDVGSTVVEAAPSNQPSVMFSGRGCTLLVLAKTM